MKWTLSKNKEDPQKDISEARIYSGQQMNKKSLILRKKYVSKCLWSHTEDPSSL